MPDLPMMTLVRAASLTHFFEVSKDLGFNPRACLQRAGLSEAMLRDPELRIPSESAVALLEDVAHQSNCMTFGLRMAQSRQLSHFGAVSLLIGHQATLRDALATTIEYRHLLNESLTLHMEELGSKVVVREEVLANAAARQATELAIGVLFRLCSAVMGTRWRPHRVNFSHAAPSDLGLHKRVFGCPVVFDSEFNGIVLSAKDLDAPNPNADPAMARYAKQFLETLPASPNGKVAHEVRRAVYLLLPMGRATSERVAQGLGMSVRSMQRQLEESGTSFTNVLNEVRKDLAPRYLRQRHYSLGRVSEILGYSTQGSFTRWFASLFHQSPSQWRAQALVGHTLRVSPLRDTALKGGPKPVSKSTVRGKPQ